MHGKNGANADAFASILTMQWRKNTHPKRVRMLTQLLQCFHERWLVLESLCYNTKKHSLSWMLFLVHHQTRRKQNDPVNRFVAESPCQEAECLHERWLVLESLCYNTKKHSLSWMLFLVHHQGPICFANYLLAHPSLQLRYRAAHHFVKKYATGIFFLTQNALSGFESLLIIWMH